ncbi:O-antigen ligase family protein [Lacinutrix salivirga]
MGESKVLSIILIVLYFCTGIIPSFGSIEPAYSQWLYISILNIIGLIYIYIKRKDFQLEFKNKLVLLFFSSIVLFFIAAWISVFKADIISESVFEISRLSTIIIGFLILFFIIKHNPKAYFNVLVKTAIIFLAFEVYTVCSHFFSQSNVPRSLDLIKSLKHNYGSFNILATSLAIKFPFAIYAFIYFNKFWKYFSAVIIVLTITAVFFTSARTSSLSLALILTLFSIVYLLSNKTQFINSLLKKIVPLVLFTLVAIFLSLNTNRIKSSAFNSFEDLFFPKKVDKLYQYDFDSSLTSDSNRSVYWNTALNDFKTSPFIGVGIGNWKLQSKQNILQVYSVDQYKYPKRVHNDFLQILAETGIVGFTFYSVGLIIILVIVFKLFFNKANREDRLIYLILFLSVIAYMVDAFFNFPQERAPIQIQYYTLVAVLLSFYALNGTTYKIKFKPTFILLFVVGLASFIANLQAFKSSLVQKIVYDSFIGKDLLTTTYDIPYNKMANDLPKYPLIGTIGRSLEHPKAMFAYSEGKYDLAMDHINKAIELTPNLHEHYGFKAILFYQVDKFKNIDSARYYAEKTFKMQPSVKANYIIARKYYKEKKDTTKILELADAYLKKVPNDTDEWIARVHYTSNSKEALKIIDTAISLNPGNQQLIEHRKKRFQFTNKNKVTKLKPARTEDQRFVKKYYDLGMQYFTNKEYKKALAEFLKVKEVEPNNNAILINLSLVQIKLKKYEDAIPNLTKVIDSNFMSNGQPEYNRALCYVRLKNRKMAEEDFKRSIEKGYPKAIKLREKLLKEID